MSTNLALRCARFRRTVGVLTFLAAMAASAWAFATAALPTLSPDGTDLMARTISAGSRHACALGEGGGVWCWGWNGSGQLGDGSRTLRITPVAVRGLSHGVTAISVGDDHACALTEGGAVYCWGSNAFGRLGDGTTVNRDVPVQVSGLSQGVTAIAAGSNSSCAAGAAGVVCWGRNQWGQLGDGSREDRWVPGAVQGLSEEVRSLAAGVGHVCALTAGGAVRCWGRGDRGQLGDDQASDRLLPVAARGLSSGVRAIDAGDQHTCALDADAGVLCWGRNIDGEVGDGTRTTRYAPTPVRGLPEGVLGIAARGQHSCAVTTQGAVWCWGSNARGQLGRAPDGFIGHSVPRKVEGLPATVRGVTNGAWHTCAVTAAGASYCWGRGVDGQLGNGTRPDQRYQPAAVQWDMAGVPAMQATLRLGGVSGTTHQRIVRKSGTPVTFGWTTHGLPAGTICFIRRQPDHIGIHKLAPGTLAQGQWTSTTLHTWAVGARDFYLACNNATTTRDVTLTIESPDYPLDVQIAGDGEGEVFSEPSGIGCGQECVARYGVDARVALMAQAGFPGSVFLGWSGACDGVSPLCEVTMSAAQSVTATFVRLRQNNQAISAGSQYTCGLTDAGQVWCWGDNYYSRIGQADAGSQRWPVPVSGLPEEIRSVATGTYHSCALTQAGGVWCWGSNSYGQLGDGTVSGGRSTPMAVSGLSSGVREIALGENHTCALLDTGAVRCWGSNAKGQLGNGGEVDRRLPVAVSGFSQGVRAIAAGREHTCAITAAGAVRCWGANVWGQLGDGSTTLRRTPVQVHGLSAGAQAITAGYHHNCAVVQGAARCWGSNNTGELGDGSPLWQGNKPTPVAVSGLPGAVEVLSAGNSFTCAITQGGAAWCWGEGYYGRLGNGSWDDRSLPAQVTGMASGTRTISAGDDHACVLDGDGLAWCWGSNLRGQLGAVAPGYFAAPEPVIWR